MHQNDFNDPAGGAHDAPQGPPVSCGISGPLFVPHLTPNPGSPIRGLGCTSNRDT